MKLAAVLLMLGAAGLVLISCGRGTVAEKTPQPPPDAVPKARQMAADAFAALSARLSEAIAEGGTVAAIEVCAVEAIPLTTAVSEEHGAIIRRLSHRPRNPGNRADALDLETIARFQAKLAAGETIEPEVSGEAGAAVVRLPIVLSQPLCLSCHGTPGGEIDAATLAMIRGRYPADEATGFSLGDLRGIWRVELPEGAGE